MHSLSLTRTASSASSRVHHEGLSLSLPSVKCYRQHFTDAGTLQVVLSDIDKTISWILVDDLPRQGKIIDHKMTFSKTFFVWFLQ